MNAHSSGLPAAPQTYAPRFKLTGRSSLDSALIELAQQPWVEIVSVNPGQLMPGSLEDDLGQLKEETDPKQFMIQSIGLQKYHEAALTIRLRVLNFQTFQEWLSELRMPMSFFRQLSWQVRIVPAPYPILLCVVEFRYGVDSHLDLVGEAMSASLRNFPI